MVWRGSTGSFPSQWMSSPGSSMSAALLSLCPSSPSSSPNMSKAIWRFWVWAALMAQSASNVLAASKHSVPRAMAIPSASARRRASRVRASATGLGRCGLRGGASARSLPGSLRPSSESISSGRGPGGSSTTSPSIRPATSSSRGGRVVGGWSNSPGRRSIKVAPFH